MRGKRAELTIWIAVIALGIIAMAVAAILGIVFLPSIWKIVPFFIVSVSASAGMNAFFLWRSRYLRHFYFASDGWFCPTCGHSLGGLGDEGTCPECGNAFEYADIQRQWQSLIGKERRKRTDT